LSGERSRSGGIVNTEVGIVKVGTKTMSLFVTAQDRRAAAVAPL
jgi:hypothetical protein